MDRPCRNQMNSLRSLKGFVASLTVGMPDWASESAASLSFPSFLMPLDEVRMWSAFETKNSTQSANENRLFIQCSSSCCLMLEESTGQAVQHSKPWRKFGSQPAVELFRMLLQKSQHKYCRRFSQGSEQRGILSTNKSLWLLTPSDAAGEVLVTNQNSAARPFPKFNTVISSNKLFFMP